ncbi:MAG TPA: circularly permuted type 2 ATP-grasp protein, partial [Polyangiaceae bacterium]
MTHSGAPYLEQQQQSEVSVNPYDELYENENSLRPHWRPYFEYLDKIGIVEAKARWSKAKQLLQENGASYNAYGDQSSSERPWRLSPIPLIISSHDWQLLSRGIAQRAHLFSSLIADIYGPQRTLLEGDLPSELVFDNPRFLRAIHGQILPKSHWLPLYGVELIRAPNAQFQVLEDQTQAPSGMGYALENRIVVAQVLPDLLRHCNVERFIAFFRLFGERLQEAAPHNRDAPRVALLTPGPFSSTYFEQAYLAKYLGLSLVQGEDLAVRNDRVYLKTLGGLQPVDVLLRRVFDDFCDPLELRPESELGVPGLVQAIRSGNVVALNPLGTGVVESPAILGYLPGLCRKLLREELLLQSVPTYYFGDAHQRAEAFADFENMVIKPTHANLPTDSIFVHQLDASERAALHQRIEAHPQTFVAQRFVASSRTPVVVDGAVRSRACVLRCFANANQPNDYQVMPGGLALVASTDSDVAVSIRKGARSKDVWVVSEEPIHEGTVLPPSHLSIELSRGGGDLP